MSHLSPCMHIHNSRTNSLRGNYCIADGQLILAVWQVKVETGKLHVKSANIDLV